MLNADLVPLAAALLAAIAFGVVIYAVALPYLSGEKQAEKRLQVVTENKSNRVARRVQNEQASSRREAVSDTIKDLEERQKKSEKISLRLRLERAGLAIEPRTFYILCVVTGLLVSVISFVAIPTMHPIAFIAVGFVGAFGIPRWVVSMMTKLRQKRFLNEFANAIDVIVRGVKSGLPLNECLGIIARETPEPIRSEFREVVEQQRVGVPLGECFERMMSRLPLPEVKFFAIVISIQSSAGGNLSEALGNLAGVLRDRKMMGAKVQALSAEAKASAAVLGSLPFAVAIMVYLSSPGYIVLLWTTKVGQFLLLIAAFWMTLGILVMRKMINFKF
jgi:tight adherence protein B